MYNGVDRSQEVLGGLIEDFPTLSLKKKSYRKNYRRKQENYRRKTGKLQEVYKRSPRAIFVLLRV